MTRLDALKELAAKVEAGARLYPSDTDPVWAVWGDEWKNSRNTILASDGSLDAALALHNALLPGWVFVVGTHTSGVWQSLEPETHAAENDMPSRAWLLAILKAYRAQVAG